MSPRILIAGYYGYGNLGDEAILDGLLTGFRRHDASLDFTVVAGDTAAAERDHHVTAIPWESINGIISSASESDLVILGGGGLFHDYWEVDTDTRLTPFHEGLSRYSAIPLVSALVNKPCMILGVGVGPLRTEQSRQLTRSCFGLASEWTVRDVGSLRWLQQAGLLSHRQGTHRSVSADPAILSDAAIGTNNEIPDSSGASGGHNYVLVALRQWEFCAQGASWEVEMAAALDLIYTSLGLSSVFVPFQSNIRMSDTDDRSVARRIRARMEFGDETTLLDPPANQEQVRDLIQHSRIVLAMRMHAALMAGAHGKPTVALAYDPKVASVMELLGQSTNSLGEKDWSSEKIAGAVGRALATEVPVDLQRRIASMRSEAELDLKLAMRIMSQKQMVLRESELVIRNEGLALVRRVARYKAQTERIPFLENQRLSLMVQRNQLINEARALRESLGGRIIQAYWNLAMKLVPEGTRRKEIYRLLMGALKGYRSTLRSPVHVGEVDHHFHETSLGPDQIKVQEPAQIISSGDPMVDYLRYQDHVRWSGADKVFVIVTTTPLRISEGQRGTQMALNLAKRGIPVVYAWWRWDPGERVHQDRLRDGIFQLPIDILEAHYADVLVSFEGMERVLLMEFPPPSLFGALARARALGWTIIYDVIDDWSAFEKVGQAPWFDEAFEHHLLHTSDAVTCVSPVLQDWAIQEGRRDATIVSNAALDGIEQINQQEHLDRGEVTLGYFGHLSPAWVDWSLVQRLAREHPAWILYFIGYGEDTTNWKFPSNVVILGKQPQDMLAAYARNWDAGIIPFKPGPLATAADPIKVYEYFAMGLPTVIYGTPPPPGTEDLLEVVVNPSQFETAVLQSIKTTEELFDKRRDFARQNSWSDRVDAFLRLLSAGEQRIAEKHELFGG
jgi:polysaccharide pyruvyl transferase CsaB